MFAHWPSSAPNDKAIVARIIKQQLDGYVGATDVPIHGMVEELLDVYPNAKVICTVCDPEPWAKSMQVIQGVCQMSFLRFALLPLGGGKWRFAYLISALIKMWEHQYGHGTAIEYYESHIKYLKHVVPEGQLFFFDVQDGWGRCATEELAQKMVVKGLKRSAVIFAGLTVGVALWYRH